MVVLSGPSPKRRRTDNGPVSADSIAQANSTLHLFTGQRQNRWMTQDHPATSNDGVQTSPKQTPSDLRPIVNGREEEHTRFPADLQGNREHGQLSTESASASTGQSLNAAGARHAVSTSAESVNSEAANIVQYESPTTIHIPTPTLTVNANSRKSVDRTASMTLPSPAPSEENINSPNASATTVSDRTSNFAAGTTDSNAPRRPGRPRREINLQASNGAFASGNGSPRVDVHRRVSSRSQRPQLVSPLPQSPSMLQWSAYSPSTAGQPFVPGYHGAAQRPHAVVPSQPHLPQPQHWQQPTQDLNSPFSQQYMRQRLDSFQAITLSHQQPRPVDIGRLALLREAVDKGDWFYIVLSQIHCLSGARHLLPQTVKSLNPISFTYLDNLLCPNSEISKNLLCWLADFPAPIMSVYSSTFGQYYQTHVCAVADFLQYLPAYWDKFVTGCKARQAPPLTEDLCMQFSLLSPVLQTTAFRAVTRMIWDATNGVNDSEGLDYVETLHRMDQSVFAQGRIRSPQEKETAYRAYARLITAWKEYEHKVQKHHQRMQHLPERQRTPAPAFEVPAAVVAAFQAPPRVSMPTTQLAAPPAPQMSLATLTNAQRQQLDMMANAKALRAQRASSSGRGSAAQVPAAQQNPLHPGAVAEQMPRQLLPPGISLMFPHESEPPRPQPTQPDSTKTALHQAHLRSPTIRPVQAVPGVSRLYRGVTAYALSPRKVNKDIGVDTMSFRVPQPNFDLIPATVPSEIAGEPPLRMLNETSQTYHLRCAVLPPDGFPDEKTWIGAEHTWPDDLYLDLNGVMLEPRRKLQHGRYLPIDLTAHIRLGENRLTAVVNRMSTDKRPFEFALAAEIVGVTSHESIVRSLPTISATESLISIRASLTGISADDDIAITSSNLTIKLFDPYTNAKIFDTPVRGRDCMHKDCFDLETFLAQCKRQHPDFPTVVDCWRCPLCRGDVRPQKLVVDGFLVEVREQLAEQNKLDTRAIVVEADGRWKPKQEETTGVRSPSLEREERSIPQAKAVPAAPKAAPEIIEID